LKSSAFNNWGYTSSRLSWVLYPLSLFYAGFMRLRSYLYENSHLGKRRLPVFTVGVGNLTMGGTGKTPFVIGLASALINRGLKVGVISRGYRRKGRKEVLVSDGETLLVSDPALCGDEPYLIALKTRAFVAVGADRVKAFSLMEGLSPDVVILDDAFQHMKVVKDVDFCLIDGTRCWGNGLVFPAGPLREPLSALKRADALIMSKAFNPGCLKDVEGVLNRAPVFFFFPGISHFLNRGKRVPPPSKGVVVTCVANYQNFVDELKRMGVEVTGLKVFPDHHRFGVKEFEDVGNGNIILTEKDWVNLPSSLKESERVFVAVQDAEIPEELLEFLGERLAFR